MRVRATIAATCSPRSCSTPTMRATPFLRIEGEIPKELEEKAMLAVDNCPEFAIAVADD